MCLKIINMGLVVNEMHVYLGFNSFSIVIIIIIIVDNAYQATYLCLKDDKNIDITIFFSLINITKIMYNVFTFQLIYYFGRNIN